MLRRLCYFQTPYPLQTLKHEDADTTVTLKNTNDNAILKIHHIYISYTCDATVVSRTPAITIWNPKSEAAEVQYAQELVASNHGVINCGKHVNAYQDEGGLLTTPLRTWLPLGIDELPPQWSVAISTGNAQAGDSVHIVITHTVTPL